MARPHRPHELGPRIYRPNGSRYLHADLRPWGGSRCALRNPKDPGWPDHGERTEDEGVARKWAWAYVEDLTGERRDRQMGKPRGRKLAKALEEYRARQHRDLARNTVVSHRAPLQALLDEFGDVPVTKIGSGRLQGMLDELTDAGYRPRTVEFQAKCWSRFFNWLGDYNPTKGLKLPPAGEEEVIHAWSFETWMKIRSRAKKYQGIVPIVQILDFAVCTGARINEVLALKWEDFNPKSGTVRIGRAFESGYTTVQGPKGSRQRVKARTALVLPELWEWYDFKRTGWAILKEGELVNSKRATEVLKPILANIKGAGGHRRAFHDARRTYHRMWAERGATTAEVQKWLGHSSIQTTERHYPAFDSEQAAEHAMRRLYPKAGLRRA